MPFEVVVPTVMASSTRVHWSVGMATPLLCSVEPKLNRPTEVIAALAMLAGTAE